MTPLLAALCVAVIGLAVVAFMRGRHGRNAVLFGRPLHRPRLWSAGVALLGASGLLRLALIEQLLPAGWQTPADWLYVLMTAAFVVILVTHGILQIRADG